MLIESFISRVDDIIGRLHKFSSDAVAVVGMDSHVGKSKLIAWSLYRSCKVLVGISWLKVQKSNIEFEFKCVLVAELCWFPLSRPPFHCSLDDRILSQSMRLDCFTLTRPLI